MGFTSWGTVFGIFGILAVLSGAILVYACGPPDREDRDPMFVVALRIIGAALMVAGIIIIYTLFSGVWNFHDGYMGPMKYAEMSNIIH